VASRGEEDGKATTRWRRGIGSRDCRWDRRNDVEGTREAQRRRAEGMDTFMGSRKSTDRFLSPFFLVVEIILSVSPTNSRF
jgi:hypothetical protein